MSQTTLDDEDLFDEAASEMQQDVEEALAAARAELPASDAIWDIEAENTLGVLNGLKSALNSGAATDHLQEAKKWYTMGDRADAFDDASDLAAAIEEIEEIVSRVNSAHGLANDLASTLPELRSDLESAAGDDST